MFDFFTNKFFNQNRYRTNSEAVIVSCFFNPQNSPYRLLAFQKFYRSIKHLNHRIIECVIGDAEPQLPDSPYITRVHSDSLLWHKESLLNKVVSELPSQFKYVFWVDADVKFTNLNWMVDSVRVLQESNIVQPFEYCIHLDRNQTEPDFNPDEFRGRVSNAKERHPKMWRSFCANYATTNLSDNKNYDIHGHVGFAWGARREILEKVPLYDRGLIGGADHIIAHAAAGQIPHECIVKSFKDDIENVEIWMNEFNRVVRGRIGFVEGDLYHYWHGDIAKRQYLRRIKDFTPQAKTIDEKDANGLYVKPNDPYLKRYFQHREVPSDDIGFNGFDEGFAEDMGYLLSDIIHQFAQTPPYEESDYSQAPAQEELRGAGSASPELYPDNEDQTPLYSSKDPDDQPLATEYSSQMGDYTPQLFGGAGSDASEDYPDNELQAEADSENFS